MSSAELQAGVAYVLNGLTATKTSRETVPPAVGLLVKSGTTGEYFMVKLRMGGARRWCPRPRMVQLASFVRVATAREVAIGWPTDYTAKEAA